MEEQTQGEIRRIQFGKNTEQNVEVQSYGLVQGRSVHVNHVNRVSLANTLKNKN
jgi:hypothetical protein